MKINMIIVTLVLIAVLLILVGFAIPAKSQTKKVAVQKEIEYSKYDLLIYTIDPDPELTWLKAFEEYKLFPPLRPERFRRKVKMLWGVDINDYPDNAIISVGGDARYIITLSKNYQIMDDYIKEDDHDLSILVAHEKNIYPYLRGYTFMNDPKAKGYLAKYIEKKKQEYFGDLQVDWADPNIGDENRGIESADFFVMLYYNAFFYTDKNMFKYNIGFNTPVWLLALGSPTSFFYEMPKRYSDLRLDMLSQFLKAEFAEGMTLSDNPHAEKNQIWLGINPNDSISSTPSPFFYLCRYPDISPNSALEGEGVSIFYRPWHNYAAEKGVSSFMSFVLQLKSKYLNKFVIKFMSGQIDKNIGLYSYHGKLQKNIRSNNYYGYSVLREFCENPMREMPTLEKIGTCFKASVNQNNTPLLLEPFGDSFDIDTIYIDETFTAYEMGHDDYYFIEIEKPVESPVADEDGYAMIIDRLETVYGYLPKEQVEAFVSEDIINGNNEKIEEEINLLNETDEDFPEI